jgi:DNA-directed RNA polymerase beta subunit
MNNSNKELIDLYFQQPNVLFTHLFDHYHQFVEEIVPYFLKDTSYFYEYIEDNKIYMYGFKCDNINIKAPVNDNDNSYKFPLDARNNNLNYFTSMTADVAQITDIHDIKTGTKTTQVVAAVKNVTIASIPIMVKSKYCSTIIHNDLHYECKYDPGGYFIVNGQEKIVMSIERMADNKPLVFSKKDATYPDGIVYLSQINSRINEWSDNLQSITVKNKKDNSLVINVSAQLIDIPLFVLFRALGIESEKDIINRITNDENDDQMMNLLRPSIYNCFNDTNEVIKTRKEALDFLVNKVKKKRIYQGAKDTIGFQRMLNLEKVLKHDLFPHLEDDMGKKIVFLSFMTRNLLLVMLKRKLPDDRDSLDNKRIETPGVLLGYLFRQNWKKMMNELGKHYKRKFIHNSDIIDKIKPTVIEQGIKTALSNGTWGINKTKKGVAQPLQRLSWNQSLSYVRRILSPSMDESTAKVTSIRQVNYNQIHLLCCLTASTKIMVRQYDHSSSIEFVYNKVNNVVTISNSFKFVKSEIYNKFRRKSNDVYKVSTDNDNYIEGTGDHKLLVYDSETKKYNYTQISDIKINKNEYLVTLHTPISKERSNSINKREVRMKILGLFYAHRCYPIQSKYKEALDEIIYDIINNEFFQKKNLTRKDFNIREEKDMYYLGVSAKFYRLLYSTDYITFITKLNNTKFKNFLSGYISIPSNGYNINGYTKKISCIIVRKRVKDLGFLLDSDNYIVNNVNNIVNFSNKIVLSYQYKNYNIYSQSIQFYKYLYYKLNNSGISISNDNASDTSDGTHGSNSSNKYHNDNINKLYFDNIDYFYDERCIRDSPFVISKVVAIEKIEDQYVYDFTTKSSNHNFIANNIISSNCVETPEGGKIGIVKSLSMSSTITSQNISQYEIIENIMKKFEQDNSNSLMHPFNAHPLDMNNYIKIFINGNFTRVCNIDYGFKFYITLRDHRRKNIIDKMTTIYFDFEYKEIRMFYEGGRLIRPLLAVNRDTQVTNVTDKVRNDIISLYKLPDKKKAWKELTLKYNDLIEYEDIESLNFLLVAEKEEVLKQNIKNSASSKYVLYTHCELHPWLMLGTIACNTPFSNHNYSGRNILQFSQQKQAFSLYLTSYHNRIDISQLLYHPQIPIVMTDGMKYNNTIDLPCGENIIIAIASYNGYNQEDSIILNKAAVDRGLFRGETYKKYHSEITRSPVTSKDDIFTRPDPSKVTGMKHGNYSKINEFGYMDKESIVNNEDVIISKISPIKPIGNDNKTFKDNSEIYKGNITAVVDKVNTKMMNAEAEMMDMKLRIERKPIIGDKFSSLHSQKATVGMIYPQRDMPFTESGIVPDAILNPHGMPSRMPIGQFIECISAKEGAINCHHVDGTPFNDCDVNSICDLLEKAGYDRHGNETMYCGITGKKMDVKIFMCPNYGIRLKHMVDDKIHARSKGPKQALTRQPLEGRSRDGGLKIGEMEKDAMIAHGIGQFLKERLMETSDIYKLYVCEDCGQPASKAVDKNYYACYPCNNCTRITAVVVPYSTSLLFKELKSVNIMPSICTDK